MKYIQIAEDYAVGILDRNNKDLIGCKHVIEACQRFTDDLKRKDITLYKDAGDGAPAERWCRFLETLPHVKGIWAAKKQDFKLSNWQIFITVNLYGWYVVKTERRRFKEGYIEVPRKNGKTFWFAGLGLGHLTIDNEFGAEVYCGATSAAQANEVFIPARTIVERHNAFREHYGIEVNRKSLNILEQGSKFQPIIGKPGDGASPSCAIADEYHEHADSDQIDTMITGMGARTNPMMLFITTAGSDMGGPCFEKREDIKQILSGAVKDDSVFGIIYTIDEDDDWDTIDAQIKANPNYGISIDSEFLEGQLRQARRSALKQVAYKTKHLNVWVGAKAAWMNMLAFQACRKKKLSIEDFKGEECLIAVDLASKIDIADMVVLFPPNDSRETWAAFAYHYLPEDTINESTKYKAWHAAGWITSTPGSVIDFEYIEDDIKALAKEHQVKEIPFDPFQATQFSIRMQACGLPLVEVGATVKNFSEPMKLLEALIIAKKIEFEFDPVLLWMMGNVVAKLDLKDNIFPNKQRNENKIDGVVAIIMALNRATLHEVRKSIYRDRGLMSI